MWEEKKGVSFRYLLFYYLLFAFLFAPILELVIAVVTLFLSKFWLLWPLISEDELWVSILFKDDVDLAEFVFLLELIELFSAFCKTWDQISVALDFLLFSYIDLQSLLYVLVEVLFLRNYWKAELVDKVASL